MIAFSCDPSPLPRPSRPSMMGNRYLRYSPLLRRYLKLESRLEYEASLLIEWSEATVRYCEQPNLQIFASLDGKHRSSTADFWIKETDGGEVVVEVKYESELGDPNSRARRQIQAQQIWCANAGYSHRILSSESIWRNPVLINSLRILFAGFRENIDLGGVEAARVRTGILRRVSEMPGICLHEIESQAVACDRHVVHAVLCDLIRCREIDVDLSNVELSPRSPARVRRATVP